MKIGIEIGSTNNKQFINSTSLIELPNNYTIIDLETTGLDCIIDEIIEISALKIRNDKIIDKYSTLIKPDYEISNFIVELTGITNSMTKNAPKIEDKIEEFIEFIGNDIIIGHNISFDIRFINFNYFQLKDKMINNNYVDTLRLSKLELKNIKHHRLIDLTNYFKIDAKEYHRSLSDCISTYKIYLNIKEIIINKYSNIENFIKEYKKHSVLKAKNITTNNTEFDTNNPFYQKKCVFTGTLDKMPSKKAMQIIADFGGYNQDSVTKETDYLIIGVLDYTKNLKGNVTNKIKQAQKLILKGEDISIISENTFYDMLDNKYKDN